MSYYVLGFINKTLIFDKNLNFLLIKKNCIDLIFFISLIKMINIYKTCTSNDSPRSDFVVDIRSSSTCILFPYYTIVFREVI